MLRRSVIASGLLHVAIITATSMAWTASYSLPDETPPAVPVDLITIADVTNVAPAQPDPPKVKPLPDPEPPPPPPVAAPPPEEAEVAPEPDKPLPKPEPPKEQLARAPEHPVRPKLKPSREKPQKFDVDSVLAFLDKSAPQTPKPAPAPAVKKAEVPVQGLGAQDAFTLDIKDALLAQMRECWNVPEGSPNPEKLIVQVRVFLTPDGSLAQPPQLEAASRAAAASNPYIRAAAEAALRAINVCEPYKHLPTEKYQVWREIVMTFDPSKMIGR